MAVGLQLRDLGSEPQILDGSVAVCHADLLKFAFHLCQMFNAGFELAGPPQRAPCAGKTVV